MSSPISSLHNPRIKQVIKLQNRRVRDSEQVTVVEGIREFKLAVTCGHWPRSVFICPELLQKSGADQAETEFRQQLAARAEIDLVEVSPAVFGKMAYRGQSGGILGLFPYLDRPLTQLPLSRPPFLVVIEGGEKPGNIGAILRTAAAAGIDGLILSTSVERPGTDMHNPNVVRASLGALFAVPFAVASTEEVIAWLQQRGILTAAATPEGKERYTAVNMTDGIALVMGSEALGLSSTWLQVADKQMFIPMAGRGDSLNLSVATALLMYEVVRQRSLIKQN